MTEQIGTVEVLTDTRLYKLDADAGQSATWVWVPPGTYPVYRLGISHYWMMEGHIDISNHRLGDGMFTMSLGMDPVGPEVKFPSKFYGPDEFTELLAHPVAQPGVEQRLKFTLTQEV